MQTTKHTPGPWTIRGAVRAVGNEEDGYHDLYCADVIPPHDERWRGTVCGIQSADHISGISKEEAEANTRLIAAAPTVLAELENLIYAVTKGHPEDLEFQLDQARSVIAKARGEG